MTDALLSRLSAESVSTSEVDARGVRLSGEVISTNDIPAYAYMLSFEVLSSVVERKPKPKFFTFLIE
jgi:hypothetical protein